MTNKSIICKHDIYLHKVSFIKRYYHLSVPEDFMFLQYESKSF